MSVAANRIILREPAIGVRLDAQVVCYGTQVERQFGNSRRPGSGLRKGGSSRSLRLQKPQVVLDLRVEKLARVQALSSGGQALLKRNTENREISYTKK